MTRSRAATTATTFDDVVFAGTAVEKDASDSLESAWQRDSFSRSAPVVFRLLCGVEEENFSIPPILEGIEPLFRGDIEVPGLRRIPQSLPEIRTENTYGRRVYGAIRALSSSDNKPRDQRIADRITALHRDALAEDESILPDSLAQFTDFFLANPDLGVPKITLTPDGTLRVRWIHGPASFVALEFTGEPLIKFVAEIPRENGLTARHFSSEPLSSVLSIARAIGASFG